MKARKLRYKNRSREQVPSTGRNEISKMKFPKLPDKFAPTNKSHRQVKMRYPSLRAQNLRNCSSVSPTDRNEVPKNYCPKTILQNRSPEQVPRSEVSKMRTPKIYATKIAHKSHPQVETRFRKRWPKIYATKSLP
jgi:hypothetical protein